MTEKIAPDLLGLIMFAGDTNLFLTHKDVSYLSETANLELERINQWFVSNELSLNVSEAKNSFFQKPNKGDDIPLLLPKLNIDDRTIGVFKIPGSITRWGPAIAHRISEANSTFCVK